MAEFRLTAREVFPKGAGQRRPLTPPPSFPTDDLTEKQPARCPKCQLDLSQCMGYVCGNPKCPIQIQVTCGV